MRVDHVTRPFTVRLLACAASVLLGGCSVFFPEPSPVLGRSVSPVRYTLADGSWHSYDELRGKNVVTIFWASWCSHSQPEMARLSALAREYEGRDDVVFLAVTVESAGRRDEWTKRVAAGGYGNLTHVYSGNGLLDETYLAFRVDSLPHVYVTDPTGVVIAEGRGAGVAASALSSLR